VTSVGNAYVLRQSELSQPTTAASPGFETPSAADPRMLFWETLGSVLWLLMDGCWMLEWGVPAAVLIAPCLAANLMVFRYTPRTSAILAVTASMNCWLAMNIAWMIDDLWTVPPLLIAARAFLAVACALLLFAFSNSRWRPEARAAVMAGFRRLRFGLPRKPPE